MHRTIVVPVPVLVSVLVPALMPVLVPVAARPRARASCRCRPVSRTTPIVSPSVPLQFHFHLLFPPPFSAFISRFHHCSNAVFLDCN